MHGRIFQFNHSELKSKKVVIQGRCALWFCLEISEEKKISKGNNSCLTYTTTFSQLHFFPFLPIVFNMYDRRIFYFGRKKTCTCVFFSMKNTHSTHFTIYKYIQTNIDNTQVSSREQTVVTDICNMYLNTFLYYIRSSHIANKCFFIHYI